MDPARLRLLRDKIVRGGPVVLAGAHSALSAKLVERAGFDGVWASGFEISAARGLPDASLLSMSEMLEVARQMADVTSVPVIADCDNGFGNAINAIRAVEEYERAGIAGICIEDYVFPKRGSFYAGTRRELATVEEHARKIHACRSVRRHRDFIVIARTEALIAGWGLEEALKRARAYADASADLILVHSKKETTDELAEFSRHWDRPVPLVAVPTTYRQATVSDLAALGYRMVIFANHALRSSVKAMHETLTELRAKQYAAAVDDRVASLEDVNELVDLLRLKRDEERYVAGAADVRAVILAAGFDPALMPIIAERPKCMLDVMGKTILERQLDTLRASGIQDISVVRGYRKHAVDVPGVRYFDNDDYLETGEAASLFAASDFLTGRTLVMYGDVLFEREVLLKLLRSEAPVSVVVDRTWVDCPDRRTSASKPDLVALVDGVANRFMTLDGPAKVRRIGHELPPCDAHGEFAGLALFDAGAVAKLLALRPRVQDSVPFGEAPVGRKAALTDLVQELIELDEDVVSVDIRAGWMDVDSFEDYRRVWDRIA